MSDLSQTLKIFKYFALGNNRAIKDKRQSNIHAYAMQYLKVNLVAYQV